MQAKSRLIDGCQNGASADHYHKTNNVGLGTRPFSPPPPPPLPTTHYQSCHTYSQFVYSNICHPCEGQLTAVNLKHPLTIITCGLIFVQTEVT